jgi:hypothetical protein
MTAWAVAGISPAGASAATVPAVATAGAAAAAPCEAWTGGQQPPDPGGSDHNNFLRGVAVLSPCNAWAVGEYEPAQTLIAHWDGEAWTQVPSPNPGTEASLTAVSPVSPSDIWAVGEYFDGSTNRTLTVHWNGAAWTQVPSPIVSGTTNDSLTAVRATSATDVWAVGSYTNSNNVSQTLILHWNGAAWTLVKSPNPGGPARDQELDSVAGVSAKNAWAVGFYYNGSFDQSIILHWNGTSWKQQKSPDQGSRGTFLFGVRASSPSNAWAAGSSYNGTADKTLIVHWNGSAWKQVTTPNPGGSAQNNDLSSIAVTPKGDAWAAGEFATGTGMRTLVLHWDGSAWRREATPSLGDSVIDDSLTAIGASPDDSVWAVGNYYDGTADQTLAIHCC